MRRLRRFFCSSFLWVLLAPYAFIGAGFVSNQAVLIANHDRFPVMANPVKLDDFLGGAAPKQGMIDEVHCVMTDQTHLNFLADVFDLHDATYSIGDFMLMVGEWAGTFTPMVFLALVFKKCWDADAV